jgi:DNA-binding FadR family transcriptional regulator
LSIITQRGNLAEIVVAKLNERIDSGLYSAGEKIPSSAQLCEEFGVSRTVIREALMSLKVSGRVIARQGAGVFVTDKDAKTLNFEISRIEDIRSAMQILELRLGVEMQAAALAATRRTPEALAEIARAYDHLEALETESAEIEAPCDCAGHTQSALSKLSGSGDGEYQLRTGVQTSPVIARLPDLSQKNQQRARVHIVRHHSGRRQRRQECNSSPS